MSEFGHLRDRLRRLIEHEQDAEVAMDTIDAVEIHAASVYIEFAREGRQGFDPWFAGWKPTLDEQRNARALRGFWGKIYAILAADHPIRLPTNVLARGDFRKLPQSEWSPQPPRPGVDKGGRTLELEQSSSHWRSRAELDMVALDLLASVEVAPVAESTRGIEPLTDNERAVLQVIQDQPKGQGIPGKGILSRLDKEGLIIDEDDFRKRIIPRLKRDYGVKNRRGAGYYRDQDIDATKNPH